MRHIPNFDLETDPRFPSGRWTGFFLQPAFPPGRHQMELHLTFRAGEMVGECRDFVGHSVIQGRYALADGKCFWIKHFLGKHDVFYNGFNEGKGIWGTWEIPASSASSTLRGGFHIWPEGMADPTQPQLDEEADLPAPARETVELGEPVAVPT